MLKRAIQPNLMSSHACGSGRKTWRVGPCLHTRCRVGISLAAYPMSSVPSVAWTLLLSLKVLRKGMPGFGTVYGVRKL